MKESGRIKNFEALGEALDVEKREDAKAVFENALKGKIGKFPKADFKSDLPGVRAINIVPFKPKEGKPAIYATIYYEALDGKEKHFTMNCFEDGVISGKIPTGVEFSRAELESEIMNTLESMNVDILYETDLPIVPDSDEGGERKPGPEDDVVKINRPLTRPERIRFLDGQDGLLLVFYNPNQGFNSYKVWLFSTPSGNIFAVLDTDAYGNAAFVVDTEERLDIDPEEMKDTSDLRIDPKDREEIVKRVWGPLSTARTRGELREQFGATRIPHAGKDWQSRIQEEIDKRRISVKK